MITCEGRGCVGSLMINGITVPLNPYLHHCDVAAACSQVIAATDHICAVNESLAPNGITKIFFSALHYIPQGAGGH